MAFVGISNHLKRDLKNNLARMRQLEYDAARKDQFVFDGTADEFVEAAWGEHMGLRALMPAAWMDSDNVTCLCFKTTGYDNDEIECRVDVNLQPPVPLPPKMACLDEVSIDSDNPKFAAMVEHAREEKAIEARWDKVDEQITTFIFKCKSLNEALKLWPQVSAYIPQAYLDKINERKAPSGPPSEGAEFLKGMDTDHLTAAVVTAKLAEAQRS